MSGRHLQKSPGDGVLKEFAPEGVRPGADEAESLLLSGEWKLAADEVEDSASDDIDASLLSGCSGGGGSGGVSRRAIDPVFEKTRRKMWSEAGERGWYRSGRAHCLSSSPVGELASPPSCCKTPGRLLGSRLGSIRSSAPLRLEASRDAARAAPRGERGADGAAEGCRM